MTEVAPSNYLPERFYNAAQTGRLAAKLCTRVIMPISTALAGYEQFIGGNTLIRNVSGAVAIASAVSGVFNNSVADLAEIRGIELENQLPIASETA